MQCGGGEDGRLHLPLHRAGEDAVRGSGRRLPDRSNPPNTETSHGADRGQPSHPITLSETLSTSHCIFLINDLTISLHHSLTLLPSHDITLSLFHAITLSLFHLLTLSPCHHQDQYQFCYRAALEYLSSFDHYTDNWQSGKNQRPHPLSIFYLSAVFLTFPNPPRFPVQLNQLMTIICFLVLFLDQSPQPAWNSASEGTMSSSASLAPTVAEFSALRPSYLSWWSSPWAPAPVPVPAPPLPHPFLFSSSAALLSPSAPSSAAPPAPSHAPMARRSRGLRELRRLRDHKHGARAAARPTYPRACGAGSRAGAGAAGAAEWASTAGGRRRARDTRVQWGTSPSSRDAWHPGPRSTDMRELQPRRDLLHSANIFSGYRAANRTVPCFCSIAILLPTEWKGFESKTCVQCFISFYASNTTYRRMRNRPNEANLYISKLFQYQYFQSPNT